MPIEETAFRILINRATAEARGGLDSEQGAGSPVVKLADVLLERSIERRASDLHLEPQANCMRIRYRVDGLLQIDENILPQDLMVVLTARFKVMAGMDTANLVHTSIRY